jgi:hypothetical protein
MGIHESGSVDIEERGHGETTGATKCRSPWWLH